MANKSNSEIDADATVDLWDALLLLDDRKETVNFMKDLCTPGEIAALSERWKVCQLLEGGQMSYRQIRASTKASLATIVRVARFLKDEPYGGYKKILGKLKSREKEGQKT
jgi:TrpR-related protein YerC/YecD